jgi:hypothetical protein
MGCERCCLRLREPPGVRARRCSTCVGEKRHTGRDEIMERVRRGVCRPTPGGEGTDDHAAPTSRDSERTSGGGLATGCRQMWDSKSTPDGEETDAQRVDGRAQACGARRRRWTSADEDARGGWSVRAAPKLEERQMADGRSMRCAALGVCGSTGERAPTRTREEGGSEISTIGSGVGRESGAET